MPLGCAHDPAIAGRSCQRAQLTTRRFGDDRPARVAQLLRDRPRGRRVPGVERRARDRARDGHERGARAGRANAGARSSTRPPCAPTPGQQQHGVRHRSRSAASSDGSVAATTAPTSESPCAPTPSRPARARARRAGRAAAALRRARRPGSRPHRDSTCARARTRRARRARGGDERLQGVAAQQRVGGDRVGAQAGHGAPRRLGGARAAPGAYAAAVCGTSPRLPSATTSRPALARMRAPPRASARPPGAAQALEARELELHRRRTRRRRCRQRAAMRRDRACGALGRGVAGRRRARGRQQLAPDRGRGRAGAGSRAREPRPRRGRRSSPAGEPAAIVPDFVDAALAALDGCLSAEPAVKRGTFPPLMVIRSRVRGLTPWRSPRSATWNLPKPVKLMSPPDLRVSVIVPSTDSTASVASFLERPVRFGDLVDELLLRHASPFIGGQIGAQP